MTAPGELTFAELGERWPEALVLWDRDAASQVWAPVFSAAPLPRLPHLEVFAFDASCPHATGTKNLDRIVWPACTCMTWTGDTWITLRAACYEATRSALRGRHFLLDAHGSQMLWFMVQDGCAAEITPSAFVVPYVISGRSDQYDLSLAPGILGFLLGGTELPGTGHLIQRISLVAAATTDGFPAWDESGLGARYVRIDDVDGRIVLRIRASVAALTALGPEVAVVDPVRFVALERSCLHCGQIPEGYRVLRDGSLVCLARGRSMAAP